MFSITVFETLYLALIRGREINFYWTLALFRAREYDINIEYWKKFKIKNLSEWLENKRNKSFEWISSENFTVSGDETY